MKRLLIIVIISTQWWMGLAVSLKQAIQSGWQRQAGLKNQQLEEQGAAIARQTAERKKWFSADAGASYLFKSEQMEVSFIPGKTIDAGSKHNYDLKVTVTQPLYTGGALSLAVDRECLNQKAEEKMIRLKKTEIESIIKTSYFSGQLLREKIKSLQSLEQNLKLHFQRQNDLFQENQIRRSDLIETEIRLEEIRLTSLDLENAIIQENLFFQRLTGLTVEEVDSGYTEPYLPFSQAWEWFQAHHPLLQANQDRVDILRLQEKMVASVYLPQIVSFAELHYGKPGIDFFKNSWQLYFQGGLSVSIPLFNWNRKQRDQLLIKLSSQKILNQNQDFIWDTEKKLKQIYSQQETAQSRLSGLKKLLDLTQEDASIKERLYQENQIANIDYLAAVTAVERYRAMYSETQAQMEMLKVAVTGLMGKNEEESQ